MSARHRFFAAALLISAATASDHISNAFKELNRASEPVENRRRFNLAATLKYTKLDVAGGEDDARIEEERGPVQEQDWRTPDRYISEDED